MNAGKTTLSIAEILEIVGEHTDYAGYARIRQNLMNQAGGGRTRKDFLSLQAEVYLGPYLRDVGAKDGMSKLHVRILDPRHAPAP